MSEVEAASREPRQERGRRRRDELLRAALELVAEHGLAGVTHRAVAQRAGATLGSTSYFFASIDDLLAEAIRVYITSDAEELDALAEEFVEGADPEELAARYAALLIEDDTTGSIARIEALLHAARGPALRETVNEAVSSSRRVAEKALRAAGATEPAVAARAFAALADGFLLHHIANPQPDDEAALREAMKAMFRGLHGQE